MISGRSARDKFDFSLTTINIILLLLFFFLVGGTITQRNETEVAPPTTQHLDTERLPRPLLLLTSDGGLFLDGIEVEQASIGSRLASQYGAGSVPDLNIIADRAFSAARFLDVVEAVRRDGIAVRIVTLDARAAE